MKKIIFAFCILIVLVGCEGIDVSKLSDEDLERVSDKLIVCDSPYIRHGSDCCLDQNNNNICDKDEEATTKPVESITTLDLDAKMDELLCPGDERVCFGVRTKTARKGELMVFGIKVLNTLGSKKDFTVDVASMGAILSGEREITKEESLNPPLTIIQKTRIETLESDAGKSMGIGIQAPENAKAGKYIFGVTVTCSGCTETYGYNKLYLDVKDLIE